MKIFSAEWWLYHFRIDFSWVKRSEVDDLIKGRSHKNMKSQVEITNNIDTRITRKIINYLRKTFGL